MPVGSWIGAAREASAQGGLCGFFFGPLGLVIACLLDYRKACPACRDRVTRHALICPHCRTALVWELDRRGQSMPKIHPESPLAQQLAARGIKA